MRELKKGANFYSRSGRLFSREHRVSFVIPESELVRSARLISNRKLMFDLNDDEVRCQVYLRANQPVDLWVDSDLYHLGKRLKPRGQMKEVREVLYKEFKNIDISGYKAATKGPDHEELCLEITGPKEKQKQMIGLFTDLLLSADFIPRKVVRPDNLKWLHAFFFLYSACAYSDEEFIQVEADVLADKLKGWWAAPPTKKEFLKIVDESNGWFIQATKAPYLMEKEVEFLLRALNKRQWFDQKQKNKFVEDLAHVILADRREDAREFQFLRKVMSELGIRR